MIRTMLHKAERAGSALIRWLQKQGLLTKTFLCLRCKKKMTMTKAKDTKDGFRWRCRRCRKSQSIRRGSIFARSHISLSEWMKVMHNLCQGLRKQQLDKIGDGICGSSGTLTKVTTVLRNVCSKGVKRLERRQQMRIGGGRAFVVLDESKFRHKRKVLDHTSQ